MGSSQSRPSKKDGKSNSRGKTTSPSQENHNSADSKAPLTQHADLNLPRSPSLDRHASIGTRSYGTSGGDEERSQPTLEIDIDEQEGHSNVSRPPPPPRLRRLSELIDPHELTIDSHIRSPSGNLLAPEQFLVHPDRPRSIRERQEQIREKVRAASRLGQEFEAAADEKPKTGIQSSKKLKTSRQWRICGCFTGR